ncbi:CRISPR-associated protein Csx11 [Methanosarcina vacuolata]|uniref:CRISPR-associated protein Csx11 n=1 Tax=Methanosarcina vacuolata Z-761 TaxID=1434123 RepID=A0A0E3Q2H9_9EURY|nr:CRISPR-associated protein Csx11 [Methanosarcina vacuolata]AKB42528.1 CRISPR-associated protein Csx11 [Methanosarcina vacuolata Z-761]
MSPDLKILADNRETLYLAEIAAWLHDMRKCSDKFLIGNSLDRQLDSTEKNSEVTHFLKDIKTIFKKIEIDFSEVSPIFEKVTLNELIEKGRPATLKKENLQKKYPWIVKTLGRCHGAAHIEKENVSEELFKQYKDYTMISNPFGFEIEIEELTPKLTSIPYDKINDRSFFVKSLVESFDYALGETRRPTNEVTLTEWSGIVAALYKSALAGSLLLGEKTDPLNLKWQFLVIKFNSEQIWGNAQNIPILATRKEMLTKGLDRVKVLIEEKYPLGNEVYRDQNNSLYVVPNIPNLLEYTISEESKTQLKQLIANEFAVDEEHNFGFKGEVILTTDIDKQAWWGQEPNNEDKEKNEIPPIARILSNDELCSPADVNAVENFWKDVSDCGICTISWLRPQGPTSKGFNRKASDCWVKRVTWRASEWYHSLDNTIWIDEVADSNGRICLLTGRLDLLEWLKPDGYISTIKVGSDANSKAILKTPSFARMHRIWRTTNKFWEDVKDDLAKKIGRVDNRLKIFGNFQSENNNSLKRDHSYKAMLDRIGFSIFCGRNNEFLIIENLTELANKFDFDLGKSTDKSPTEYLKKYLSNKKVKIYDSEGKNRLNPIGCLKILEIEDENTSYVPVIPILAEPSIFMTIIPADKALEASILIKTKYEKEMGKVRNRLPLSLGMVFAKSHTPLAALMDAGRKMLRKSNKDRSVNEDKWILEEDPIENDNKFTLKFNNGTKWEISSKMGDEITTDYWYPYFYAQGDFQERSNSFIHSFRNYENSNRWLIHVSELKKGDMVSILPSKFDFEFLDSASRRFEICYNEKGYRRDSLKALRPYLLEELDNFTYLWDLCSKNLSNTQIKNVITLVEKKREEWAVGEDTTVFETFVHDVLYNANWNNGRRPDDAKMSELEDAAKSGKLRDILELYMNILKYRAEEPFGGI